MTNRTASLLMLFVLSLVVTGTVLGIATAALAESGVLRPWFAPLVAVVCQSTTLYAGRRYVLQHALARTSVRAAAALMFIVSLTMGLAIAVVWSLQRIIGAGVEVPSIVVPLWFALIWLALRRQQIWQPSLKNGVR